MNGSPPTGLNGDAPDLEPGALAVLRNRPFLLLWLAQAATQVGGNVVLFGLTVIVVENTHSPAAVSGLILTFLVPAVLFSALAGVFVDRLDPRLVLVVTNVLRAVAIAAMVFARDSLAGIYLLNILVSTMTTFFSPAEAAMIPKLVPRGQLVAANGLFTITLNAAFALGFALLGPLFNKVAGTTALLLVVAALYFVAALFCVTLPGSNGKLVRAGIATKQAVVDVERAVSSPFVQLWEGLEYIRRNPTIAWSIIYLGSTASLIGVLGVLGPSFAQSTLGLLPSDFVVVVLPLGLGVVMGILALNNFGHLVERRRLIETGLVALGLLIALLSVVGSVPRLVAGLDAQTSLSLSTVVTVLSVVTAIAFLAGVAYALVAISSQTQLQEELPEDVRGRVYGVLFTLVSVASFVPVIAVGGIAEWLGTTPVMLGVAVLIGAIGVVSIVTRRRAHVRPQGKPPRAGGRRRGDQLAHPAPLESPILTPDSAAAGTRVTNRPKRTRR